MIWLGILYCNISKICKSFPSWNIFLATPTSGRNFCQVLPTSKVIADASRTRNRHCIEHNLTSETNRRLVWDVFLFHPFCYRTPHLKNRAPIRKSGWINKVNKALQNKKTSKSSKWCMFGDSGLWIWNPKNNYVTKFSLTILWHRCLSTSWYRSSNLMQRNLPHVASEIGYVEIRCSYSELNGCFGSVICFWKVICFWMIIWTASKLVCHVFLSPVAIKPPTVCRHLSVLLDFHTAMFARI